MFGGQHNDLVFRQWAVTPKAYGQMSFQWSTRGPHSCHPRIQKGGSKKKKIRWVETTNQKTSHLSKYKRIELRFVYLKRPQDQSLTDPRSEELGIELSPLRKVFQVLLEEGMKFGLKKSGPLLLAASNGKRPADLSFLMDVFKRCVSLSCSPLP